MVYGFSAIRHIFGVMYEELRTTLYELSDVVDIVVENYPGITRCVVLCYFLPRVNMKLFFFVFFAHFFIQQQHRKIERPEVDGEG